VLRRGSDDDLPVDPEDLAGRRFLSANLQQQRELRIFAPSRSTSVVKVAEIEEKQWWLGELLFKNFDLLPSRGRRAKSASLDTETNADDYDLDSAESLVSGGVNLVKDLLGNVVTSVASSPI